ncbi:MAG: hypothetical protein KAV82_09640 [Phycisphaerae bacterium]|nr:hypothetical protein [Phycisphaerae bacterium]
MVCVTHVVRLVAGSVFLASALLVSGCETPGTGKEQAIRLIANSRPYEKDIPLPAGFTIVEQAMEDHSTGQSRTYLRHLYSGRADKFAVRRFYREQMPLLRWSKMSDSAIKGEFTMRFAKGSEVCVINIHGEDSVLGKKASVQVMVAQEQRGATPPLAQNRP